MANWHVLPRVDGGWVIQSPGAGHAAEVAQTEDEAIAWARELISYSGGGQLVVQDVAGEVRWQETIAASDPWSDPEGRQ